jgi:hypothetical protein
VAADLRPGEVDFPLFLHVLGAMLLVGTLLAVATAIVAGWRRADADQADAQALTRFGLWTLVLGVLPSFVLLRLGALWTESRADLPEEVEDATWMDIGYLTADGGEVLVLVAVALSIIALRRMRRGGGGAGLGRAVGIIAVLLLAAYVIAVWAMSAKPE